MNLWVMAMGPVTISRRVTEDSTGTLPFSISSFVAGFGSVSNVIGLAVSVWGFCTSISLFSSGACAEIAGTAARNTLAWGVGVAGARYWTVFIDSTISRMVTETGSPVLSRKVYFCLPQGEVFGSGWGLRYKLQIRSMFAWCIEKMGSSAA